MLDDKCKLKEKHVTMYNYNHKIIERAILDIYYLLLHVFIGLDMITLCRLDGKLVPLGRKHLNVIICDFHLINLFSIHLSP